MQDQRALIAANLMTLPVLLTVVIAGWWDAGGFGLAVLLLIDLLVLARKRWPNSGENLDS